MDSNTSGFFGPVEGYGSPDLASFSPIPTSEDAICELYRGERAGRFRVYKFLKPQYRGNLLHEGILKKEFEAGYSLRHVNICEVYSFMEIEGLGNCIEMEWIDGITLEDYLLKRKPDERTFRNIASQLCDAMIYLHSHQLLHRDLKPSNIMISHEDGTVKLIDFGLADMRSSSILKSPAGSRWWVAPEILVGEQASVGSDIYSLGAVLKMMTPGHRKCINRCISPDPKKRYESVQQVKEDLLRRKNYWPVIATAALSLLLVALVMIVGLRRKNSYVEKRRDTIDTVYVIPATVPQSEPQAQPAGQKAPAQPKAKPEKKREVNPDEIFEKASDLFEENL